MRDQQAVNRRNLDDVKTDMMTITTTTMTTVIIARDQMSGTNSIAIAISTVTDMTPVQKVTIAVEPEDHENHLIHLTDLDTPDIGTGLHPGTEINSRVPADTGRIQEPELRANHLHTIRDHTNSRTTSINIPQVEDTVNHLTLNNITSTHTLPTAPKDRPTTSMDSGTISRVGYCNRTEVGLTPVPNILGNRFTTICLQPPEDTTNFGCTAIRLAWACKLNPSTGENLL